MLHIYVLVFCKIHVYAICLELIFGTASYYLLHAACLVLFVIAYVFIFGEKLIRAYVCIVCQYAESK